MKFIDTVVIKIKAGHGGKGSAHFCRTRHNPKGGPDGGDGGRGGHIVAIGSHSLMTLFDISIQKCIIASSGNNGKDKRGNGKNGKDTLIEVPLGTCFYHYSPRCFIGEITRDKQRFVLAYGGKGGKGNCHFCSSTRQRPTYSQPGLKGKQYELFLELRTIADIAFIGQPNAGKSSLLKAITNAQPKVAAYPYTTLVPNLGVLSLDKSLSITIADIPGIDQGAHIGNSLGNQFLRHAQRTKGFIMVLDGTKNVSDQMDILKTEITQFDSNLLKKIYIGVVTKYDLWEKYKRVPFSIKKIPIIYTSVKNGFGLENLKKQMGIICSHGEKDIA